MTQPNSIDGVGEKKVLIQHWGLDRPAGKPAVPGHGHVWHYVAHLRILDTGCCCRKLTRAQHTDVFKWRLNIVGRIPKAAPVEAVLTRGRYGDIIVSRPRNSSWVLALEWSKVGCTRQRNMSQ